MVSRPYYSDTLELADKRRVNAALRNRILRLTRCRCRPDSNAPRASGRSRSSRSLGRRDRGAKPISDGRAIRGAMRVPVIILNFKTYPEILGKKGWELAKRFAAVADDTGASIVLAPPTSDLAHIAKLVHIPVVGQHVDPVEPGQTTGWTPPEALLEAGAAGTLINHSERKVAWEEMATSIPRCQKIGLEVIACADALSHAG